MFKLKYGLQGMAAGAFLAANFVAPPILADDATIDYSARDTWLCRPDYPRACGVDMTTTVVQANGNTRMEPFSANPNARVDCFYVYPTVSQDTTPNSDMVAGPEEYNVVRSQFARLGAECRTFAPLYRQVTLTALRAGMGGGQAMAVDREMPYNDVLNAWNYYLENHNDGRGVILIGHSQGAGVLTRLIANAIEGTPAQDRIISAMLLGTTIQVPADAPVGATFQHMPLCESGDQTGCIVTYSSYRNDVPPPATALFGRNGQGTVAACTSPAQLVNGGTELHAYLSNAAAEGFSSTGPSPWTTTGASIHTPFVSVPGLISGECVSNGQFHYLEVTVNADPNDQRTNEITGDVMNADGTVNAGWGLHLIDANVAMGDLVALARRQARAYLIP